MNINTAENLFSSSTRYIALNKDAVKDAINKFLDLKKSGIIKDGSQFADDVWYTTDQFSNVGLHFTFDEKSFKRSYEKLFEMDFKTFLEYSKVYIVSLFNKSALTSISNALLDMRHIINTSIKVVCSGTQVFNLYMPWLILDFFSILGENIETDNFDNFLVTIDRCCEDKISRLGKQQRSLATFDTYFLFDEIINRYWRENLSLNDRLFYYPLYLWWQITAVIPLRPREFIITERNCLSFKDGEYFLKLRRNRLKGSHESITYTLEGDYDIFTCKIPEHLARIIQDYINLTSQYDATEIDTLFVADVHYKKWGMKKNRRSRYLTYTNMNTILRYFYSEVIIDRYGYNVLIEHESTYLKDGDICYIHLGDTRHIALINIMQEGGTPVTAMQLAGHTNTEMAAHYYSNITKLIECKTYRQYRRMISGESSFSISNVSYIPSTKVSVPLKDGGKCYSEAYRNFEITDCLSSIGDNGEIGYCPKCEHYRCQGISYFGSDDIYKRNIEDDCKMLTEAIERVRHEKGSIEDIGEVMFRLHSSSQSYQAYLLTKMKETEE